MRSTIGDVRRAIVIGLVLTFFAAAPLPLRAIEPADPEMSAEAREVLDYLASIYGRKTLIGQDKFWEADRFHETTGKYPAIISSDLSGWSKIRSGTSSTSGRSSALSISRRTGDTSRAASCHLLGTGPIH